MAPKRPFKNKLNDLNTKQWIKFQKSWFIHNPPPRKKNVIRHPAKFPETLAQDFIEFFSKRDALILDPMAGTGSTLIASLRCGRNSIGIELNPEYADIARELVRQEREILGETASGLQAQVITADAANVNHLNLPAIDYILTSPPYWNMLHARGAETQQKRRASAVMDVTYSDHPSDLGNIDDYDEFLERLIHIYQNLVQHLKPRAYITVIVKNLKKGGKIFPLAWDLARHMRTFLTLKDERIWLQDNVPLAPYGMGNAWVSNIHHHYCLQFRYEPDPSIKS
jgi:DNA modification methylase